MDKLSLFLPKWLSTYPTSDLAEDVLAGLLVGILVIPQSLGYAVLAGLPPVYGLYASIVPVLVYAWVGSSSVNAVGAVAITAIMTAQALQPYQHLSSDEYASLASLLALMVGVLFYLASVLRLGWVTQLISRGVTAGFISAAAIVIFVSQLKYVSGIALKSNSAFGNVWYFFQSLHLLHTPTLILGLTVFIMFLINRYFLSLWLIHHLSHNFISLIKKTLPLAIVIATIAISDHWQFANFGIQTIGNIPQGMPTFQLPKSWFNIQQLFDLLPSAGLIALIGFISSHTVASKFARQRQQTFSANQELKGLGLANIIGSFFQIFPVVGGFSRTAVNVEAGAKSPIASIITSFVILLALLSLGQLLTPLPYAILGAMIMVSVISLIDFNTLKIAYQSDQLDAIAFLTTFFSVLIFDLNTGLIIGLFTSLMGLIWQSIHPHIAIVGEIEQTGHFRNIKRHQVTQHETVLILRIDEQLFYGNTESVRQFVETTLQKHPKCQHLLLMLSAVNRVDLTAQQMLIELNQTLKQQNIQLHFSEIKGPVMDILQKTPVIDQLSGQVFLSTQQAIKTLISQSQHHQSPL